MSQSSTLLPHTVLVHPMPILSMRGGNRDKVAAADIVALNENDFHLHLDSSESLP